MISYVAIFILNTILTQAAGFSLGFLGLSSGSFSQGHIYQLITYPFLGNSFLEVIFNGLLFWFIGSELENLWGPRRYLYFLLTSSLGAGIIFILIGLVFFTGSAAAFLPLTGMSGLASALCLAYAVLFPDQIFTFMLIIPMKAKYFCMLLIGMQLFYGFTSPMGILSWGHLGAMLSGFLYMMAISNPRFKKFFKKADTVATQVKFRKGKPHLKIVPSNEENGDGDDDDTPKYWQ